MKKSSIRFSAPTPEGERIPAHARFELTLQTYRTPGDAEKICELIYDSKDKNLLAALSSLPYTIGRTFSGDEAQRLSKIFKEWETSFVFKSLTENINSISYSPAPSPSLEAVSAPPSGIKQNTPPNKKWAGFGILLAASVSAFFFLKGVTSKIESPSAEKSAATNMNYRATVERIFKDVEFRREKDFSWKSATPHLQLQDQDSIRTFESSQATLLYIEGFQVVVKPNTLLTVGSQTEPKHRKIRLEDGSIQARLKAANPPERLSIETKSGTLEMTSPIEGEASETRIETRMHKNGLVVSVAEGKAVLRHVKNTTPIEIIHHQQLTATEAAVSEAVPFTESLPLMSPTENATLTIDPQTATPTFFRWEDLGDGFTYEWNLSTDPQMKNVLFNQKSNSPEISLQYIDLGVLYWQVTAVGDGKRIPSPVWRLNVQKNND